MASVLSSPLMAGGGAMKDLETVSRFLPLPKVRAHILYFPFCDANIPQNITFLSKVKTNVSFPPPPSKFRDRLETRGLGGGGLINTLVISRLGNLTNT